MLCKYGACHIDLPKFIISPVSINDRSIIASTKPTPPCHRAAVTALCGRRGHSVTGHSYPL